MFPCAFVLAVDDLGLCRMHLEPARCQSRLKLRPEGFCLLLGPAMHKSIVSISTPWEVGMCPRHPEIKRIVQEEIGQIGLTTPPCGVPRVRSMISPSFSIGAVSHLSM